MLLEMVLATVLTGQDAVQTCGTEFGRWVCRTTDNRPPAQATPFNSFSQSFEAGARMGAQMRERRAEEEAARRAQESAGLRQTVIAFVRRGDCTGAVNAALEGGDLALATEARQFCAVPPQGSGTASQPGN